MIDARRVGGRRPRISTVWRRPQTPEDADKGRQTRAKAMARSVRSATTSPIVHGAWWGLVFYLPEQSRVTSR